MVSHGGRLARGARGAAVEIVEARTETPRSSAKLEQGVIFDVMGLRGVDAPRSAAPPRTSRLSDG